MAVTLEEHLFRRESARLVAALTRIFGVHNLALAEDVAQDAFVRALEVWKVRGVPDNPSAWLMTTARNRAIDLVRREHTAHAFAPELSRDLQSERSAVPLLDESFAESVVLDEQLRMMFSCCHPRVPEEAQIALILNILCGFGAGEIASAFLVTRAAVEKRITRGKRSLAEARRLFDFTDSDFASRLSAVQRALYLLFSEGYHGAGERAVRAELCTEAMRLTALLSTYPAAATPATHALAALMHMHAARLPARSDALGDLTSLGHQDRSLWDKRLIAEGLALFERSAAGAVVSQYHIEAAIAAAHLSARTPTETNWRAIVSLYDRLMTVAPSPVVALNRAIAVAELHGAERGLNELVSIAGRERLARYPFYEAALGELQLRARNADQAATHFETALGVARNDAERRFLEKRLRECQSQGRA